MKTMKTNAFYNHPNPRQYQLEQWGAALLLFFIGLASVGLFILALIIPAPLFLVMALLLLLLAAPVLMLLVVSPPLAIEAEGLRLLPQFGKKPLIRWEEITAIAPYPLLPSENQELLRKALLGRKHYREAEGIMLLVPSLPWPYRIAAFFAGRKAAPIVALTNRSHADYYHLKALIEKNAEG